MAPLSSTPFLLLLLLPALITLATTATAFVLVSSSCSRSVSHRCVNGREEGDNIIIDGY